MGKEADWRAYCFLYKSHAQHCTVPMCQFAGEGIVPMVHSIFTRSAWLVGVGLGLMCTAAFATVILPGGARTTGGGVIHVSGGQSADLHVALGGQTAGAGNVTFGFFDLSQMTAGVNDPDFALQALQADHAIVLHEAGQALADQYDVTVSSGATLGMFILRNGTLADFSRGQNPYGPIFSLSGAPGSQLVAENDTLTKGGLTFLFNNFGSGQVFGASGAAGAGDPLMFGVTGVGDSVPIVPEPATLTLVGLGLAGLGLMRRRHARS